MASGAAGWEARLAEVRLAKVRLAEVCLAEVRLAEVRSKRGELFRVGDCSATDPDHGRLLLL